MIKLNSDVKRGLNKLLSNTKFQWLLAALILFSFSWMYMGSAIGSCSTATASLGSDSTGGIAWAQWAGGNDFEWGQTEKSNFPFGEKLDKPQFITSTFFIGMYKIFSVLTTPICGLNLIVLVGYMSTGLLMFGLIRWLFKRFDIAIFAAYAATFVPFHTIKAESHINYIYGSTFISLIWAFLWLLSKPTYIKAVVLGLVSSIGFYFDGYYILLSALLIIGLFGGQLLAELFKIIMGRKKLHTELVKSINRLKYTIVAGLILCVALVPILLVYKASGDAISQSLATVRSNIKAETLIYGARPIELVLPAANNRLMPRGYADFRMELVHGSNLSESTLYAGLVVLILSTIGTVALIYKKNRQLCLRDISSLEIIGIIVVALAVSSAFSLPAHAHIYGYDIPTPTMLLINLTSNWRVLSRIFLVVHPLLVVLASFGLYWVTKNFNIIKRSVVVFVIVLLLFLEFLPSPLGPTGDLYKNTPLIYKQLAEDKSVNIVAEYPLADFSFTPSIFTFQPVHNKTLINSNDGSVSKGPFDSSIAGLDDPQTIGALQSLKVDEIITHGFEAKNINLVNKFKNPVYNSFGKLNVLESSYAYMLKDSVVARPILLILSSGFEALSVDKDQLSHRIVTNTGYFNLFHFDKNASPSEQYIIRFSLNSICKQPANIIIKQNGQEVLSQEINSKPEDIIIKVKSTDFSMKTTNCSVDVTKLSAEKIIF